MTQIKGIDVSHHNGAIDWKKVAGDGVQFAFMKATEGTSFVDNTLKPNVAEANALGIKTGAYHYAKFSNVAEAKAEAQFFLKNVAGVNLTYPLVLDLEENKKNASRSTLTDAAIAFLQAIKDAGYIPMLYTGKSFLETVLDESRLKPYALWIARYGSTLGRSADIWQYTETGKVAGIVGNVDVNWAYRDFSAKTEQVESPVTAIGSTLSVPTGVIRKGDKGNAVSALQSLLNSMGFNVGQVDGSFGPATETALKGFQSKYGLVADGVYGPGTAVKMTAVLKTQTCSIIVNGAKLDTKGIMRDNLSYLPVRSIGNATGVSVGFENGKALLGKGVLQTTILIGDYGYAHAREIADVLGYKVEWDGNTQTVKLTKGQR